MSATGVTTGDVDETPARELASDDLVAQLRAAMRADRVQIELGSSWSMSLGVVQTARIRLVKEGTKTERWSDVGPLLVPPAGEGRAGLLELLRGLLDDDQADGVGA